MMRIKLAGCVSCLGFLRKEERSFFCYEVAISKNSVWSLFETLIIIISNTIFFFGIYYKNFFWNLL